MFQVHHPDPRGRVWGVDGREPAPMSKTGRVVYRPAPSAEWSVLVPLSTLEVRWFFAGPLEASGPGMEYWFRTRARFGGGGRPPALAWEPAPPAWRQDRYLLVPGHGDMGIKWREGRLEIKGREAALGRQMLAPGVEGMCERWLKWSYASTPIERCFLGLFGHPGADGVVLVEKRRLQRCIRLDAAGAVEVGCAVPRRRGVNVELAQTRVAGSASEAHWSLGFEASPADPSTSEGFAAIVAGFLEGCPALPLTADRSMSYPHWLLGFDRPA
jgi:hypothetical protein